MVSNDVCVDCVGISNFWSWSVCKTRAIFLLSPFPPASSPPSPFPLLYLLLPLPLPSPFLYLPLPSPLPLPLPPPSLLPSLTFSLSELEWMLSEKGVLKTDLEEDPRKKREIRDVMSAALRSGYVDPEDSDDSD